MKKKRVRKTFSKSKRLDRRGMLFFILLIVALVGLITFYFIRQNPALIPQAAGYTVEDLIADAGGNNDGTLCPPVDSYDWGQKGDGLPSTLGSINSTQVTGWGTAQWVSCGASASGVRHQVQNFKMLGWTGSNWVTYNGQPGDWCATSNPDTSSGYSGCSNSGSSSSPNWAMETGQRALHWATSRMPVQSGTRCVVVYYEAKSTGTAPIMVNVGADHIDTNAQIQPRLFLSRYKRVSQDNWTPIGGSSCTAEILKNNPPPGLGTGLSSPTPPLSSSPTPTASSPISGTVNLSVVGNPITGPYIVEAKTNLPGDIRVEFYVDGSTTPRVVENEAPYSLFGDNGSVLHAGRLGVGSHTVVARVFSQNESRVLASGNISITEGSLIAASPSPNVTPTPSPVPVGQLKIEYYNNKTLSGSPVAVADISKVVFDWGSNIPTTTVNRDNFSARIFGRVNFDGSIYRFNATSDDGVRVKVDGVTVVDGWRDQPRTTYNALYKPSSGTRDVLIEYYDSGWEAVLYANWFKHDSACADLTGDGIVTDADMQVLADHYGTKGDSPWNVLKNKWYTKLFTNEVVNSGDQLFLANKLGTSCSI